VLSKLAAESDRLGEARRFALVAAVFHPYGYVLENSRAHVQISSRSDVASDIEDLRAGKSPFQALRPVMERLSADAAITPLGLIDRNLSRSTVL
jgi:hypothetical protein